MECYYHPERESTDVCAICGKSVCKECGLEIGGKVYCKDCLEKIVGLGLDTATKDNAAEDKAAEDKASEDHTHDEVKNEPARLDKSSEYAIYKPQDAEPITPQHNINTPEQYAGENKVIADDSPYNIKDNITYSGGLESSYLNEEFPKQPQDAPKTAPDDDFIYPDHTYEPKPRAGENLEDKYERYLDDLYFDENEIPLTEQLAKDEEQYGSLTKKPHKPQKPAEEREFVQEPGKNKKLKKSADEELEARIRAAIEKEMMEKTDNDGKPIHNLNYQQEKEPLGVIDIILTLILVIVILIVVYYLIYLFILSASYPTFIDALYALSNPQNVINNILK